MVWQDSCLSQWGGGGEFLCPNSFNLPSLRIEEGEGGWHPAVPIHLSFNQRHIIRYIRPSKVSAQLAGWWGQWHWSSVWQGKKYFFQNENLLYRHGKPNEPTKEGPLSLVLFESPFISVSTVGMPIAHLFRTELTVACSTNWRWSGP
jgi:hypothetical protein